MQRISFKRMERGAHGCEADDMLGCCQGEDTIICSIDKDLLQIPGQHYNFVKDEYTTISEYDGLRNIYKQALIGDRSDNVIGINGIGPVKAERAFSGCTTEKQLYEVCKNLYGDVNRLNTNLALLWIWRSNGDVYDPVRRKLIEEVDAGPDQSIHHCGVTRREQEMASEVRDIERGIHRSEDKQEDKAPSETLSV